MMDCRACNCQVSFWTFATMHASHNDCGSPKLRKVPESLFGGLVFLKLFSDELCRARLSIGIDLGLELFLNEVWSVLERQIFLL